MLTEKVQDGTTRPERFLTVREVSRMLRKDETSIRRHLREGALPGARIGEAWRVRRSDLEALFDR